MMQILSHTPIWVFALLVGLVGLGLLQRRTRAVRGVRLLLLPLGMLLLSVSGVWSSFGASALAWLAWFGGWALAALPAVWQARRRGLAAAWASQRFQVAGSWLPLSLMLLIFSSKYAIAVSAGMKQVLPLPAVTVVCAVLGISSGALLARALRVLVQREAVSLTLPASAST